MATAKILSSGTGNRYIIRISVKNRAEGVRIARKLREAGVIFQDHYSKLQNKHPAL